MKKKQVLVGVLICLILISYLSFLFADDLNSSNQVNTTIDNETSAEIQTMENSSIGAQMRVLQLQENLQIKILEAQAVIAYIQNKQNDTSNLQAIVTELQTLKDEAGNISIENKTYAVQQFVDVKSQAKDLVKQFKDAAAQFLNDNDKRTLQAQFNQIEKNSFQDLKQQIQSLERQLWAERVQNILDKIGVNDTNLINGINNSSLSANDIKAQLKEDFGNLTASKKIAATLKLRNDLLKIQNDNLKIKTDVEKNMIERIANQADNRAKILESKGFTNASIKLKNFSDNLRARLK